MTRFDTFAWLFFLTLCLPASATGGSLSEVLVNYYQHSPNMQSSAQPVRDQFSAIRQAGVEIVVNLSPYHMPGALPEEKRLVEDLGMVYFHIPINWKHPSLDQLKDFFAIMDAYNDRRVLTHSWINSRSSAFIYLYRTSILGEPEEEEYRIMSTIWENNTGYELENVPWWQRFIRNAKASLL